MGGHEVEVRMNGRSYDGLRRLAVAVVRAASGRLGWLVGCGRWLAVAFEWMALAGADVVCGLRLVGSPRLWRGVDRMLVGAG